MSSIPATIAAFNTHRCPYMIFLSFPIQRIHYFKWIIFLMMSPHRWWGEHGLCCCITSKVSILLVTNACNRCRKWTQRKPPRQQPSERMHFYVTKASTGCGHQFKSAAGWRNEFFGVSSQPLVFTHQQNWKLLHAIVSGCQMMWKGPRWRRPLLVWIYTIVLKIQ